MEVSALEVGDEVECPGCGLILIKCIEKPIIGALNWHRFFEITQWQGSYGSPCECHSCNTEFMTDLIHIKGKGWIR